MSAERFEPSLKRPERDNNSTSTVNPEQGAIQTMSTDVDAGRRRFLTAGVSVVGGVATIGVAVPYVVAWQPSERARAIGAPVEVDISKIELGQMLTHKWRGKPVWIVSRPPEVLEALPGLDDRLRDPDSSQNQQPAYARNEFRSIKPEILVLIGICTHLGCAPSYIKQDDAPLGPGWPGGFFCPCHGSRFDYAGRVYSGVPAPTNLVVPPHTYLSDTRILIGADEGSA
jgi:ubiquinol-cytochrome c reductase iron-sulfur subunit